jgi:Zn finger protein HypA/HybF involved in hydrogenase expression
MSSPEPARRWSRTHTACRTCGTTTVPHKARGLCQRCHQAAFRRQQRIAARRIAVPRFPDKYPDWHCRQCHTTIRPPHSAGLCVDCVRAAGGLRHDPWEAA